MWLILPAGVECAWEGQLAALELDVRRLPLENVLDAEKSEARPSVLLVAPESYRALSHPVVVLTRLRKMAPLVVTLLPSDVMLAGALISAGARVWFLGAGSLLHVVSAAIADASQEKITGGVQRRHPSV